MSVGERAFVVGRRQLVLLLVRRAIADAILLPEPLPQIDLTASLRAEREVRILRPERGLLAADWTARNVFHASQITPVT
jgi:hypothetical protein